MPNSKINYLEIIKQAAYITWRNKYLWWLGFFVTLSACGGSFFRYAPQQDNIQGREFFQFTAAHKELAIVAGLVFFLVWIIFAVLGIIGKGGLIKSINTIAENKKTDFRSGFSAGKKYFWKIFFIGFLTGIFILAALVIFMVPIGFLFYNKAYVTGAILSILAVAIFIPVVFIASFIKIYGYFYAVLSDLPMGEALENAYALLRKNILPSITISLIFLLLGTAVTLAAVFLMIPVVVIFFIIGALLFLLAKHIGIIITSAIALAVILAVMLFGGAVYQTFAQAVMVLFFREIATPKEEEKIAEPAEEKEIASESAPDPVVGN